ncbi:MAG: penicillin-binding transpeptidase domain-containing protein, partial [Actinomycetota bacterium]|nr:penicillin-binding transpeptidase domain-containing protein [Actinomycetota bacterium]
ILGRYMNTVYFGNGAYGIQAAARTYFSRDAWDLTLPQAALLAGMIAGPERYDPMDNPKAAKARRNEVLREMRSLRMIKGPAYRKSLAKDIILRPKPNRRRYPAAYFIDYVKDEILNNRRWGETYEERYDFLFKGGLRIYTTIDLEMQEAAEEAVAGVLSERTDPYGAMTVIDPRNGKIKAMVGGRDYFKPGEDRFAKLNLATGGSTGRQAGSAFKTFTLVAALEQRRSPRDVYQVGGTIQMDEPPCASPEYPWQVRNYDGAAAGAITIEQATIRSVNVAYAQIIRDVGPEHAVEVARRMGIRSPLQPFCSSVLGTNEVNTLEMASAYGTLATNGVYRRPVGIEKITDGAGRVLYEWQRNDRQVISPSVAWQATQILRKVILYGTGTNANIGRPAAGKTGTAQQWRDAWFAGYIPQLSAAVWVGFPEGQIEMVPPVTRRTVTGGSFPAQIWATFMSRITRGLPVRNFSRPAEEYVTVEIDVSRGCLPNDHTPSDVIRRMQFVPGTEPTEVCEQPRAPEAVEAPSVVGVDLDEATGLIQDAGLTMTAEKEYTPNHPPGTVLSQAPPAGTAMKPGQAVALVVASGDAPIVPLPDVVGMTRTQAISALQDAGFQVVPVEQLRCDARRKGCPFEDGVVWRQRPRAGAERPMGRRVTILLNVAPEG